MAHASKNSTSGCWKDSYMIGSFVSSQRKYFLAQALIDLYETRVLPLPHSLGIP